MAGQMPPSPSLEGASALDALLDEGVIWGDSGEWLPRLPQDSVDLFFMSPPYADERAYSKISPDSYVEWFLPPALCGGHVQGHQGDWVVCAQHQEPGGQVRAAEGTAPSVCVPTCDRSSEHGVAVDGDVHLEQAECHPWSVRTPHQGCLRVRLSLHQGPQSLLRP